MDLEPNKEEQPNNGPVTATLEPPKPTEPTDNTTPQSPNINQTVSNSNVPPAPPTVTTTNPPEKAKSKKKWLIIALISLLVLGGSVFAFFTVYIPYAEKQVFNNTIYNTFSATSFKADAKITATNMTPGLSNLELSGALANGGDGEATLSLNVLGNKVALDTKYVDSVIYVRVSGVNSLVSLIGSFVDPSVVNSYSDMISSIDDQWISIDNSTLSLLGLDTTAIIPNTTDQGPDKLVGFFDTNPFIELDQRFDDENISGSNSYHYSLKINTEVMSSFLDSLVEANYADITAKDAKSIKTTFDATTVKALNLDLWVDKDQEVINQVTASSETLGDGFSVTVGVSDYNAPFTIEAPADAVPIMNLLVQLAGNGSDFSSLVPGLNIPSL